MRKIFKDPLFVFLAAGVFLFVFWEYWGSGDAPENNQISVSLAKVNQIENAWTKQMQRPPRNDELKQLIEQYIEEEILYREALAMGLQKDDVIIRRRLTQKISFLIQDVAAQEQPTETELRSYFDENKELFKTPGRISFTHIYFSQDIRGDAAFNDAEETLGELNKKGLERLPKSGDPFMLHYDYSEMSGTEVFRLFGEPFATEVFRFKPGKWAGPVQSGYGIHLVRVLKNIPSRMPEFDEVKDSVRVKFMDKKRKKANESALKNLKGRYRIVIDKDASTKMHGNASMQSTGDAS